MPGIKKTGTKNLQLQEGLDTAYITTVASTRRLKMKEPGEPLHPSISAVVIWHMVSFRAKNY
jgi:hypothetical protein